MPNAARPISENIRAGAARARHCARTEASALEMRGGMIRKNRSAQRRVDPINDPLQIAKFFDRSGPPRVERAARARPKTTVRTPAGGDASTPPALASKLTSCRTCTPKNDFVSPSTFSLATSDVTRAFHDASAPGRGFDRGRHRAQGGKHNLPALQRSLQSRRARGALGPSIPGA